MSQDRYAFLRRRISDFCRVRVAQVLPPRDQRQFQTYLLQLIADGRPPPHHGRGFRWEVISQECGISLEQLKAAADQLKPGLAALVKEIPKAPSAARTASKRRRLKDETHEATACTDDAAAAGRLQADRPDKRRSVPPRPIVEFPEPLQAAWDEPDTFCEALALHMRRHRDTAWSLHRAVVKGGETFDRATISSWMRGAKAPRAVESLEILRRIERRYRLPTGYFKAKHPHPARSALGHSLVGVGAAERRRLAWHLPDDFDSRPRAEQEEILEWVRRVIITGSTEYRRYQAAAMKTRFALRFPGLSTKPERGNEARTALESEEGGELSVRERDPDLAPGSRCAPRQLREEMTALLRFKTSTLTALGYQRNGTWGEETAAQKLEHLSLLFGALAASPHGAVRGFGVPPGQLTFGLLAFPAVWDWYVRWREQRRGFYTVWEVDMLRVALALTRKDTGWIRQTPGLAQRLMPIAGLVSQADIETAQADWPATCENFFRYALARAKEIQRVARVHRDPFEPILPVLEADSPVGEYRKITEEILRLMPDERRYPRARAEAVRTFLMLRLGLHLGLRQKNLRQLLLCHRGRLPTPERTLIELKCGELSWSERDHGWQVFIPPAAFKNATSSFFGSKPFRLVLPDLADLYRYIDEYVGRHRAVLLGGAPDPKTFFVKTVKASSRDAAYDQNTFYDAWRLAIQRYGIFNPYTERGAIEGLLPHGPHNVRDVLATHILKKTGSYEQASYAIQDTPDVVAKHYGRFLPQDKAALAAQVLNEAWDAA